MTVTLRGISNKHCLLSLFSFVLFLFHIFSRGHYFSQNDEKTLAQTIKVDYLYVGKFTVSDILLQVWGDRRKQNYKP